MGEPLLTVDATVTCPHGGQGTITPSQSAVGSEAGAMASAPTLDRSSPGPDSSGCHPGLAGSVAHR